MTEATTTHTNNVRKPLVLSDAIANESIPTDLRRRVSVRVVDFAVERERFCPVGMPGKTFRCLEALQRFVLLEMLLGDARASPRDLAIIADVDEIVRPSVVSMLRRCYPWDEDGSGLPGSIILRMTLFKYGVHCDLGNTFMFGARAYSVGHLARSYSHAANASAASLHEKSMGLTGTRDHQIGPVIDDAGWHLTSFGSASELARKLRTFLHSNIFVHRSTRATALDPGRLERCMRFCLDLSQPRTANGSMPPCAGRDDPKSRRLPGRVHARMSARLDLPPPLLRPRSASIGRHCGFGSSGYDHHQDTSEATRCILSGAHDLKHLAPGRVGERSANPGGAAAGLALGLGRSSRSREPTACPTAGRRTEPEKTAPRRRGGTCPAGVPFPFWESRCFIYQNGTKHIDVYICYVATWRRGP